MSRETVEFYCPNCRWYNYPRLSTHLDGAYIIICGHCKHQHYRVIKKGEMKDPALINKNRVTEHRRNGERLGESIHVMPSACQSEPRKRGLIARIRELEVIGAHK